MDISTKHDDMFPINPKLAWDRLRTDYATQSAEGGVMRTILEIIAGQKLTDEMDCSDADFEGAYECMIHQARDAISACVSTRLECEHGKGMTDYCEPCGRINGG